MSYFGEVDWVMNETLPQKLYANLERKLLYRTLYDGGGGEML